MSVSAIIAGAAIGSSLIDTVINNSSAQKQYQLGKETLEYQKQAQQTTWDREDNAIQRRVADLKAAGLSPVLAAGQGAQASGPIQVTTPQYGQRSSGFGDALSRGMAAAQLYQGMVAQHESIAYTAAQRQLVEQQTKNVALDTAAKNHDLSIALRDGMPTNPSGVGKMFRDGGSFMQNLISSFKEKMQQGNPKPITVEKEQWFKNLIEGNRAKKAQDSRSGYYSGYVDDQKRKAVQKVRSDYYSGYVNSQRR